MLQPQLLQPQTGWQLQVSPHAQRALAFGAALAQPQLVFGHWHWLLLGWFMVLTPSGALDCALRKRDAAPAGALQGSLLFFPAARDRSVEWQAIF